MKLRNTKNSTIKTVIFAGLVNVIASLVTLGFSSSSAMAIGLAITGITTSTTNGSNDSPLTLTSTNPASFLNPSSAYPVVFGNDTKTISSITTATGTYSSVIPLSVVIRRSATSGAAADIFYSPLTSPLTFNPPAAVATGTTINVASGNVLAFTQEQILAQNNISLGSDNLFTNIDNTINNNNIERLDFISAASGFTASNLLAFSIIERGAANQNDGFRIAAITSLDGSGNPNGYGNLIAVAGGNGSNNGDYGTTNLDTFQSATFKGGLPSALNGTQSLRGLLIRPTTDLGITAGTTIYGYSLFADDVTGSGATLVDFTNTAFFPTNTADGKGGLDLIAGNVGVVSVPFDFNPQFGVVVLGAAWFVRSQLKKKAATK